MRIHPLIVPVLPLLSIAFAVGCQSTNTSPHAAEVEAAVAKLHLKMTAKEADAVLDPLALEKCTTWWPGEYSHQFRMKDGREIWLVFKDSPPFTFKQIGKLGPHSRWERGRFTPTLADAKQAVAIVQKTMQRELLEHVDLEAKYATDATAEPEWGNQHRLPLILKTTTGESLEYDAVTYQVGEYHVYRFVKVNIARNNKWVHRVTVNLTKQRVEPLEWEPDQAMIDALKPIALTELRKLEEVQGEIKCDVFGSYEFEPKRRLITFMFEYHQGTSRSITLDADTGKLAYPDDDDDENDESDDSEEHDDDT